MGCGTWKRLEDIMEKGENGDRGQVRRTVEVEVDKRRKEGRGSESRERQRRWKWRKVETE